MFINFCEFQRHAKRGLGAYRRSRSPLQRVFEPRLQIVAHASSLVLFGASTASRNAATWKKDSGTDLEEASTVSLSRSTSPASAFSFCIEGKP